MIGFFAAIAVLLVLALLIVLPTLLRKTSPEEVERRKINIAIGRERLSELSRAREADDLSEEEFEQERRELEESLIDDIEETGEKSGSSIHNFWAVGALFILVPVLSISLYSYLGMPAALSVQDLSAQNEQRPLPTIDEMVSALEQRMQQNPENVEGWAMLARTYMVMQQYDKAADALYKLRDLVGDSPDVLVDIADAVAMKQGGRLDGEPVELLRQALEANPAQLKALWLVGMYEFQQGNAAQALVHWRKLEPMLINDPESRQELGRLIARAEQQTGESAPVAVETPVIQSNGALTVKVSMSESMIGKFSADDTLFIFAQARNGPPMPLAVYRGKASDLPVEVRLDDSMAMTPMMKLSSFEDVSVMARVSKSGQAKPESGDLYGVDSGAVIPGQKKVVEILVDRVQE
jgi:cytochrome c-type biogenesis protein CcmH